MIDPETIDLSLLPSVSLADRSQLPQTPCIYFAIDSQGVVQYIGQTTCLAKRWLGHHRYKDLSKLDGVRITYLAMTELSLLKQVETVLIEHFQPVLNSAIFKPSGVAEGEELKCRLQVMCRLSSLIDARNLSLSESGQIGKRLTQRRLAEETKIAATTLNRLYNNTFDRIDVRTVQTLCDYFECEIGELFVLKEVRHDH